jgi:hypothetical protein
MSAIFYVESKVISYKFIVAKLLVLYHFVQFASIFRDVNKNNSRIIQKKKRVLLTILYTEFNVPRDVVNYNECFLSCT